MLLLLNIFNTKHTWRPTKCNTPAFSRAVLTPKQNQNSPVIHNSNEKRNTVCDTDQFIVKPGIACIIVICGTVVAAWYVKVMHDPCLKTAFCQVCLLNRNLLSFSQIFCRVINLKWHEANWNYLKVSLFLRRLNRISVSPSSLNLYSFLTYYYKQPIFIFMENLQCNISVMITSRNVKCVLSRQVALNTAGLLQRLNSPVKPVVSFVLLVREYILFGTTYPSFKGNHYWKLLLRSVISLIIKQYQWQTFV